jgi:hypothetical protein
MARVLCGCARDRLGRDDGVASVDHERLRFEVGLLGLQLPALGAEVPVQ